MKHLAIPEEKIVVIPYGVDRKVFRPLREGARACPHPYVLFVVSSTGGEAKVRRVSGFL